MKNNRFGSKGGWGDLPWMYGSRGDPPLINVGEARLPMNWLERRAGSLKFGQIASASCLSLATTEYGGVTKTI